MAMGGTFWRVREILGPQTTDRPLIESWKRIAQVPALAAFAGFADTLVGMVEKQEGASVAKQVRPDRYRASAGSPA